MTGKNEALKCNGPIMVPVVNDKRVFCYGDRCPLGIGKPLIVDKGKEIMYCYREMFDIVNGNIKPDYP